MKKLLKTFEERGIWWLPQNLEVKISGLLTYTPFEGTSLTLDGAIGEQEDLIKIIHGELQTGELCTLVNCFYKRYRISPSHGASKLVINDIYF